MRFIIYILMWRIRGCIHRLSCRMVSQISWLAEKKVSHSITGDGVSKNCIAKHKIHYTGIRIEINGSLVRKGDMAGVTEKMEYIVWIRRLYQYIFTGKFNTLVVMIWHHMIWDEMQKITANDQGTARKIIAVE